FFQEYKKGFESFSVENVSNMFSSPMLLVHKDVPTVWGSKQEITENVHLLLAAYKEMGLCEALYVINKAKQISAQMFEVSIDWKIINKQNEVISDFSCIYHLIMINDVF